MQPNEYLNRQRNHVQKQAKWQQCVHILAEVSAHVVLRCRRNPWFRSRYTRSTASTSERVRQKNVHHRHLPQIPPYSPTSLLCILSLYETSSTSSVSLRGSVERWCRSGLVSNARTGIWGFPRVHSSPFLSHFRGISTFSLKPVFRQPLVFSSDRV